MTASPHFTPALFEFLRDLRRHNDRDWFDANRARYEKHVKEPALRFITDFGSELYRISPHILADPRPVGGSLFRIHRDTRFSKDKRPYKTNVGLHFRHEAGKDAHVPSFYLHLEPGSCFAGVGIWRPDASTARQVRNAIVERPAEWRQAAHGRRFRRDFDLAGETLKRPPAGFDAGHEWLEDLKRKDFTALARLSQKQVVSPDLLRDFTKLCERAAPFVSFLCQAVGVAF